ncbi:MAG: porin [Nitrospinae bacterium]|nr:porin [Nitrospinota bacterium]MDA1110771.1 porin [Nitrospinota bacterium]
MQKLLGMLLILGVLISAPGSAWSDMSQNELRLLALEEKFDALREDRQALFDKLEAKSSGDYFKYTNPGFEFTSPDGLFSTKLVWRAQLRFTHPNRSDPRTEANFTTGEDSSNFEARRLRMKIGGHGYKKWIKYYFEVDLQPSRDTDDTSSASSARVIDYRLDVQPSDAIGFRVGQWKINYNRERVDSSGRQTFVERSIVNREFTIDRQVGALVKGRLFKDTPAFINYYAGVFNGEGRSVNNNTTDMMYMGRVQWNFIGKKDLKWYQSDVKRHDKPAGQIAFAAATNTGPCTRWSSSGCGNLEGLTEAASATPTQFRTEQWVQEFAFKWKGLALQQEYHEKNVRDKSTGLTHDYTGLYAQVGYFPHGLIPAVPEQLEIAFRYAFVDAPDVVNLNTNDNRDEFTAGLNYFIKGHNNKITLDYSHLTLDDESAGRKLSDDRVRLQWDISF